MTIQNLPHQLNHAGGIALVVFPDRATLCLRCRSTGHVGKNSRVPKCDGCHNFGHTSNERAPTYATATVAMSATVISEHIMDEV